MDDRQGLKITTRLGKSTLLSMIKKVVFDEQGMPLRLDTVDPRAYVLHKTFVSQKTDRRPAKRRRDEQHVRVVATLIARELTHFSESAAISRLFSESLLRENGPDPGHRSGR